MTKQFDRSYRLSAGAAGSAGFEIGETSLSRPTALHICFAVDRADTKTPDLAKISIWNLNDEQLAILYKKDCVVALRAGYGSLMSLIFVGDIAFASTIADRADRETALECVDGGVRLRDTFVTLSYGGAVGVDAVIRDIALKMGVAATFSHDAEFGTFPKFSFVGPARSALDKACASSGLQWNIQNGVLQVKRKGGTMGREAFLLSPNTGLLGVPRQVMFAPSESKGDKQQGWEVEYLMNGAVGIGDFVRLESRKVAGYFRTRTIELIGDNVEGDWKCTATLVEA